MADLDGDGHLDVMSGAYWPGNVFWFRGLGDGSFAASQILKDSGGTEIVGGKPLAKGDENPDMDSLASAPWLVDWDADGDLDLLIGNIAGRVVLVRNEGSRTEPRFSTGREVLEAGGDTIDVGGGDSGPTVADWDGDGKWDLIVGGGDGSVWWFRNEGEEGAPAFAAGRALVAPAEGIWEPVPHGGTPSCVGARAKPHVVDYDGDGDLDLLVGDYRSVKRPEPVLTDEQRARRDALQKEQVALQLASQRFANSPKGEAAVKAREAWSERWQKVYEELEPLTAGTDPAGWVWLFERK